MFNAFKWILTDILSNANFGANMCLEQIQDDLLRFERWGDAHDQVGVGPADFHSQKFVLSDFVSIQLFKMKKKIN